MTFQKSSFRNICLYSITHKGIATSDIPYLL
jgi:hypothetical protein